MPYRDAAHQQNVLDVAMAIMQSNCASMQVYDPDRHALRLLMHRGFIPSAADAWTWVFPHSGTGCAISLTSGVRTVVPDIELCQALTHQPFRDCGIRALQSTPLRTADRLVGMVSTYWTTPHQPTADELHLFDLWARQTADVLANGEVVKLLREVMTQIERSKQLTREIEQLMLHYLPVRGSS